MQKKKQVGGMVGWLFYGCKNTEAPSLLKKYNYLEQHYIHFG